jgi:hypothetical protein
MVTKQRKTMLGPLDPEDGTNIRSRNVACEPKKNDAG